MTPARKTFLLRLSINAIGTLGLCVTVVVLLLPGKSPLLTVLLVSLALAPYVATHLSVHIRVKQKKRMSLIEGARWRARERAMQPKKTAVACDASAQVASLPPITPNSKLNVIGWSACNADVERKDPDPTPLKERLVSSEAMHHRATALNGVSDILKGNIRPSRAVEVPSYPVGTPFVDPLPPAAPSVKHTQPAPRLESVVISHVGVIRQEVADETGAQTSNPRQIPDKTEFLAATLPPLSGALACAASDELDCASKPYVELQLAVSQLVNSLPSPVAEPPPRSVPVSSHPPDSVWARIETQQSLPARHTREPAPVARPPASSPKTVLQALHQIEGTGELITVLYAYGSRAGQPRELTVLSLFNGNEAMKVLEVGEPQEKTYIVKRIMEVRLQDGTKVTNPETTSAFREWERERNEYQRHRQNLIDTCHFGSVSKLKECRFEVSRTPGGFLLSNKQNYQLVIIQARDIEAARRGAYALEIMLSESEGLWWELQAVLINNGVHWPAWMEMQRLAYQDGQRLLHEFERENPGILWHTISFKDRSAHYFRSPYWGEEESWKHLEWGQIFEASDVNMATALQCMSSLTKDIEEFKAYILGSNGARKPMNLPNVDISLNTLNWLKARGLAVAVPAPEPRDILGGYRVAELKELARSMGLKFTGAKKVDLVNMCLRVMTPEDQKALLAMDIRPIQYLLNAPPGLNWDQFQHFKACYRKMFSMLIHYVDRTLNTKESVQRLLY